MKMKLTVLLATVSLSTFAGVLHVEPSDSVSLIPTGSSIEFVRDFNVKPKTDSHLLGEINNTRCVLITDKSTVDRVIKSGTKFDIEFLDADYGKFSFKSSNSKIEELYCYKKRGDLTVKQFTDAIAGVAKLEMSGPEEF